MKSNKKIKIPIDNVDIQDLLSNIGIPYTASGKNVSSGWIGVQCVFPGCDDHHNHLGINLRSKTVSCWKCGRSGTIIAYLSRLLGSLPKALEVIREYIPRELHNYTEQEFSHSKPLVTSVALPDHCLPGLSDRHKVYLHKRKFDPDYLEDKYNLHHVGPVGKWATRIIVPIMRGFKLVTFTSVDIHDETITRYKHLEDELSLVPIKNLLYNADTSDGFNIYIVEGLFDCWRIGDGCIPTWGVKFTKMQKFLLSKYGKFKVIGDGDKEGWKMNQDLSSELAAFGKCSYIELESGVDPDQLTEEEVKQIRML